MNRMITLEGGEQMRSATWNAISFNLGKAIREKNVLLTLFIQMVLHREGPGASEEQLLLLCHETLKKYHLLDDRGHIDVQVMVVFFNSLLQTPQGISLSNPIIFESFMNERVTLKDGSEMDRALWDHISRNIGEATRENPRLLPLLVKKCRLSMGSVEEKQLWESSRHILTECSLLDKQGRIKGDVESVILNSIRNCRDGIELTNPIIDQVARGISKL